jgi:hypothetical protein
MERLVYCLYDAFHADRTLVKQVGDGRDCGVSFVANDGTVYLQFSGPGLDQLLRLEQCLDDDVVSVSRILQILLSYKSGSAAAAAAATLLRKDACFSSQLEHCCSVQNAIAFQ